MLIALLVLLYGCGCTEINCEGSIGVSISGVPENAGVVTVEVREDGQTYTCTWEAPGEGTCTGGTDLWLLNGTLEEGLLVVSVPTYDRDGEGTIDVTVYVSEAVALDTRVEPDWEPHRANGPGCGITCYTATAELTLDE